MLELELPEMEWFDEKKEEFRYTKSMTLRLEHSLVSISKWESKWKKPFLSKADKTIEETIDYIKCMTISQNVDPEIYNRLGNAEIDKINAYLEENRTATTFNNLGQPQNRRIVTSELIYYWMSQYNIPIECQKWHLSRLMTLIRIASMENAPKQKMSTRAILSQNSSLNAARRKALHTKG